MGQLVLKNARPAVILDVLVKTVNNARSEGSIWDEEAQVELAPLVQEAQVEDEFLEDLQKTWDREQSALTSASRALDLAVASARDEVWNKLGRPAVNRDLVLTSRARSAAQTWAHHSGDVSSHRWAQHDDRPKLEA